MNIIYDLKEISSPLKNPVLTIGNFDGVHRGHLALFDKVKERLFKLADHLRNGLKEKGYRLASEGFSGHSSAIVVCEKPGLNVGEAMAKLKNNGVIAAERLGRIRFSPHIYISPEQIEKVVQMMD